MKSPRLLPVQNDKEVKKAKYKEASSNSDPRFFWYDTTTIKNAIDWFRRATQYVGGSHAEK